MPPGGCPLVLPRRRRRRRNGKDKCALPPLGDRDGMDMIGDGWETKLKQESLSRANDDVDMLGASQPQYESDNDNNVQILPNIRGVPSEESTVSSKGESFAAGVGDWADWGSFETSSMAEPWASDTVLFGDSGSTKQVDPEIKQVDPEVESKNGDGAIFNVVGTGDARGDVVIGAKQLPSAVEDESGNVFGTNERADGREFETVEGSSFEGTQSSSRKFSAAWPDDEELPEPNDWMAVGGTAALMSTADDDLSRSIVSRSTLSTMTMTISAMGDTNSSGDKASELQELVDACDWAGIVLTARKLEAETEEDRNRDRGNDGEASRAITDKKEDDTLAKDDEIDCRTHKDDNDNGVQSASGAGNTGNAGNASSVFLSSVSTMTEETAKRNEVKAEVKALVRLVLPNELDNLETMMMQFEGREDELLQSLRTMQERSLHQRARAAVYKSTNVSSRTLNSDRTTSTNDLESPLPSSSNDRDRTMTSHLDEPLLPPSFPSNPHSSSIESPRVGPTGDFKTIPDRETQPQATTAGQANDCPSSSDRDVSEPQLRGSGGPCTGKMSSEKTEINSPIGPGIGVSVVGSSLSNEGNGPELAKISVPDPPMSRSEVTPEAVSEGPGNNDSKLGSSQASGPEFPRTLVPDPATPTATAMPESGNDSPGINFTTVGSLFPSQESGPELPKTQDLPVSTTTVMPEAGSKTFSDHTDSTNASSIALVLAANGSLRFEC